MKVLIAAQGPTLDDQVAKRFGHASYYLILDSDTLEVRVLHNTGHDESHSIIPRAAREGVTVAITGNIGPQAFELSGSCQIQVALARKMSAKEALQKLRSDQLRILEAPTVQKSPHEHRHDREATETHSKRHNSQRRL
jgi:predicted Fe-Mo cluster-binding NifX family protein